MGPKNEAPAFLYHLKGDGEIQILGKLEDVQLQDDPPEAGWLESLKLFAEMYAAAEVKGTVKIPGCRSRKRYVKLLMASGKSRNFANRQADAVHARGDSWKKAWARALYFHAGILPKPLPEEEREIKCLKE